MSTATTTSPGSIASTSPGTRGPVGLSACLGGEIPRALEIEDWDSARRLAGEYQDILGKGNFFLELQDHGCRAAGPQRDIEANKALRQRKLQFLLISRLGNLTLGSAACCHTKDGLDGKEFGQVSSYVTAVKWVNPAGDLQEASEETESRSAAQGCD